MNFRLNFRRSLRNSKPLWLTGGGGGGQSGAADGGCTAVPGGGRFHRPSRGGPEGVEKEEARTGQEDARESLDRIVFWFPKRSLLWKLVLSVLDGLKSVFEDTRLLSPRCIDRGLLERKHYNNACCNA